MSEDVSFDALLEHAFLSNHPPTESCRLCELIAKHLKKSWRK